MSIAISQSSTTAAPVQPTSASSQKTTQAGQQPTTVTDTVHLSAAAQSAAAALKEVSETSTQTAQEAVSGDLQARNLLARETAAKSLST
jgi:hypothetical protein